MVRLSGVLLTMACLGAAGTACFVSSVGCKPKAQPSGAAQAAKDTSDATTGGPSAASTSDTQATADPVDGGGEKTAVTAEANDAATNPATAASEDGAASPARASDSPPMKPTPEPPPAKFSSRNLVVMGKGGPRFFKLNVNVARQDLEEGFQVAMRRLAAELSIDFDNPIDWNALVDKPLVASGWLGNLVPTAEQREQLRGLYDANNNEKVDEAEFQAFVTRGLSRTPHLKFSKRRPALPLVQNESLWGPIDLDDDGELTKAELEQTKQSLMRYDFDSDRILTLAEFRSAQESDPNMATGSARSSVYDEAPAHLWDAAKPEPMAKAIIEHYSLSRGLARDQCYAWPKQRMEQLDIDKDDVLIPSELRNVTDEQLDGTLQLSFPDALSSGAENLSAHYHSIDKMDATCWLGHPEGGRVTLDGCIVTVVTADGQDPARRDAFMSQLERFENDAQLRTVLMQALELKDGAFDTLDAMAAERQKSDGELAWSWLVAPRQWHVQITCSASLSPWFELIDHNGDRKLSMSEVERFAPICMSWDRNSDGVIQENEMPVSVLLEVKRSDVRGSGLRLGGTDSEKRGANEVSAPTWFTGMDYNSDGELSESEFLGERSDFEKLDRNRDGIIEAREVTTPQ